jgi:uncharacterized Tic20 family protein
MRIVQEPVARHRSPARNPSLGALACIVVLLAMLAAQAISGALIAGGSRQYYPAGETERQEAVSNFLARSAFHSVIGHLTVFVGLILVAFTIVFASNVGAFEGGRSRYPWVMVGLAVALTVILFGALIQGNSYRGNLERTHSWLTPPAGGFPEGSPIAAEQVVTSQKYFTFVTIHGIVLPFVVIILMIFLWPSFWEHMSEGRKEPRSSKWAAIK